MPAFDIFKKEDINNMHPKSDGSVLYRVEAAKPTKNGSSLQAYCRNRTKERITQDFAHKKIIAPAYNDGGPTGSKTAIFGCAAKDALENIGKIEISEHLPHPMIDGQWGKTFKNRGHFDLYKGGKTATLYTNNWEKIKTIPIDVITIENGENFIQFDCDFTNSAKNAEAKIETRTLGIVLKLIL